MTSVSAITTTGIAPSLHVMSHHPVGVLDFFFSVVLVVVVVVDCRHYQMDTVSKIFLTSNCNDRVARPRFAIKNLEKCYQ
jgi:hypothetical protein